MIQSNGGTYHVFSRCVRRAWLCGQDVLTGRDFTHRRAWIEDRIHELADIFAVSIHAYAVMSNHYHIVLTMEPDRITTWQDENIVDRWLSVCPGRRTENKQAETMRIRRDALLADPAQVSVLRNRLSSLSWFMRFINEPLARLANKEDGCTGRFWEGRFKSQLLLNEAAMLACMSYVDLNPVRAGIAQDISDCQFTSISRRLRHSSEKMTMSAFGSSPTSPFDTLPLSDYIRLLEWTCCEYGDGTRRESGDIPSILREHVKHHHDWLTYYLPRPGSWRQAVGPAASLKSYAQSIGRHWIQGWSLAPTMI